MMFFGYENWIDLIGTDLVMGCSIPRKSCICALISRIALSDTGMDDLRAKNSDLGVHCTNIH